MILWLVMGVLVDLVFKTASSGSREYEAEADRYLAARGYFRPSQRKSSR